MDLCLVLGCSLVVVVISSSHGCRDREVLYSSSRAWAWPRATTQRNARRRRRRHATARTRCCHCMQVKLATTTSSYVLQRETFAYVRARVSASCIGEHRKGRARPPPPLHWAGRARGVHGWRVGRVQKRPRQAGARARARGGRRVPRGSSSTYGTVGAAGGWPAPRSLSSY